ncbi:hypothetical protein X777_16276 [Ooceraea biroi]|uniref:Transposase domain-containing protein n=1 Tax=Ooceraea biroi TaxID=2015173 RepID=A0A026VXD6_OOCBI|nr:hypothetical protein X777_16276 [Ooceraea biroi]
MSQNYYRQKKYRKIKRLINNNHNKGNKNNTKNDCEINNIENNVSDKVNKVMSEHNEQNINFEDDNFNNDSANINLSSNINDEMINDLNSFILSDDEVNNYGDSDIKEKIQQWTLNNIGSLQLNVVTDLLQILREEGHSTLPKTAQTLLGTTHHRILQQMQSVNGTGEYIYIGIEHGLKRIIDPDIFIEKEIIIFVHIDGVQIYNNSQIQVWPILIKIVHDNWVCEPFVVALYCGDSKPLNASDYLINFVTEASKLINSGVTISGKTYAFTISGIIADSPARSFIKCIKSPGAFYACERCTIKGITVGEKGRKKRVYPQIYCSKRTKETFQAQNQVEHHKENLVSPLSTLRNFDIINDVVLDSMHLLYLGVMKYLMEN